MEISWWWDPKMGYSPVMEILNNACLEDAPRVFHGLVTTAVHPFDVFGMGPEETGTWDMLTRLGKPIRNPLENLWDDPPHISIRKFPAKCVGALNISHIQTWWYVWNWCLSSTHNFTRDIDDKLYGIPDTPVLRISDKRRLISSTVLSY